MGALKKSLIYPSWNLQASFEYLSWQDSVPFAFPTVVRTYLRFSRTFNICKRLNSLRETDPFFLWNGHFISPSEIRFSSHENVGSIRAIVLYFRNPLREVIENNNTSFTIREKWRTHAFCFTLNIDTRSSMEKQIANTSVPV